MLLETLRTRDSDELAEAFQRWDLRIRQLGRGPFRGQLQFLQLGGIQVFREKLGEIGDALRNALTAFRFGR